MRNNIFVFIIAVFLLVSVPLLRGEETVQELLCPAAALNSLYFQNPGPDQQAPVRELSLEEVTRLALDNSLDIQIARFDAYIARTSLGKAESIFDTYFTASAAFLDDEEETSTSAIFGSHTKTRTFSTALSKKLPTGTQVSLEVQRTRTTTDSAFSAFNPYRQARATVSLVQPLGKNFFGMADRASIKITKADIENSEFTSLDNIESTLSAAQVSYWNLALKEEELAIKRDMLGYAHNLNTIYREKYEMGLVEKPDMLATLANVKVRASDVSMAYFQRDAAKNDLLFLLNLEDLSVRIRPGDSLKTAPREVDVVPQLREAIEHRRDYKQVKTSLRANKIDVAVKKNALWPEIDLEASFSRNGLDREYREAWKKITDQDNSEIYVGLKLQVPLENTYARADLAEANLVKEQLLLSLKRTERLILKDIHNVVKEVNTLKEQVELLEVVVELQKEKLQEEMNRLRFGRSNADLLIRYQEDLLNARLSLAQVRFSYRVALIELEETKNTLLDTYWEENL